MNPFESKNKNVEAFIKKDTEKMKSNRGRKTLQDSQKKSNVVSLYLSDTDYKTLKEKAEKARLPLSQYIVSKLFGEG